MIFGGKGAKIAELEARIKELEEQNAKYREVLTFYANPKNWSQGHKYRDLDDATIFHDPDASSADVDHGEKAADALKGR